jgi:oligopeptide transport system ATP-binding protein
MTGPLLLEGRDLSVTYRRSAGVLRPPTFLTALDSVAFTLAAGESLAVVGESGSGKSTLARAVLRLVPLAAGQVLLRGEDLAILTETELRARRRELQMIFQDPIASLDPRMRIAEILAQPLRVFEPGLDREGRRERAARQLAGVGLEASMLDRYPHQFSGGQAQRIGIARALIAAPSVLVCDEPVSALDVSIRTQVLELLAQQRAERGLALLFIAHDLGAVRFLCDRTLVLYRGQVMEQGPTAELFSAARHPYTRALLDAALIADPVRARRRPVRTEALLQRLAEPAAHGCPYSSRCAYMQPRCQQERAPLRAIGQLEVACHRAVQIGPRSA